MTEIGSPEAAEGGGEEEQDQKWCNCQFVFVEKGFFLLPRGSRLVLSRFPSFHHIFIVWIFISCPASQVFPQTGICSRPLWSTPQLLVRKKEKRKKEKRKKKRTRNLQRRLGKMNQESHNPLKSHLQLKSNE